MYFNTTISVTTENKGDSVCRPGDWMDVAKFFLFNFVVHALTVVNAPGAKTLRSVNASLTAILLPFSGAYRAFQAMAFYRWEKEDDLHIALRAQALCTPIPSGCHPTGDVLFPALNVIDVHGQHSVPPHSFLEWTGIKTPTLRPSYQLSRVPWWFAITPLKRPSGAPRSNPAASGSGPQTTLVEHNPMSETKISCDYNIMKIFAAILQILSGVFQIFQARGLQLDTYGYSAYSLTVIPYVLMSLVNLLACVCIPQYPLMYIVHYGGKKRPVPNDPADTQENNGVSSLTTPRTLEGGSILTQGDGQESDPVSPIERPTDEQDPLLADNNLPTVNNPHQSTSSLSAGTAGRQENIGEEEDGEHFGWEPEVKEMVSGVVGVAYGEWDFDKRDKTLPQSETSTPIRLFIYLVAAVVLVAPYLIMSVLTGFEERQSTKTQRSWILAWLIMGQIGGLLSGAWENEYWRVIGRLPQLPSTTMTRFIISFSIIVFMSIGTIGGFIVVGNMILEDQVCTVI